MPLLHVSTSIFIMEVADLPTEAVRVEAGAKYLSGHAVSGVGVAVAHVAAPIAEQACVGAPIEAVEAAALLRVLRHQAAIPFARVREARPQRLSGRFHNAQQVGAVPHEVEHLAAAIHRLLPEPILRVEEPLARPVGILHPGEPVVGVPGVGHLLGALLLSDAVAVVVIPVAQQERVLRTARTR